MFGDAGINAIYATQYKRTQQTVKRSRSPGPTYQSDQFQEHPPSCNRDSRSTRRQVVFIAGHNSTVPEIVSALAAAVSVIPESEYDNLYIVTVYRIAKRSREDEVRSLSPSPTALD